MAAPRTDDATSTTGGGAAGTTIAGSAASATVAGSAASATIAGSAASNTTAGSDADNTTGGNGARPTTRGNGGRANERPQSARLFFALWPSPAMQAALAAAVGPVLLLAQSADASARPVPAANFHLTLAFLGSVPVSRLREVDEAATRFAQISTLRELPIEIVLDAIEHWRKAQVLVATASTTPAAAVALGESLQHALVEAGFSPDLKPFRVHATIARKVRRVAREYHLDPVRWSFDDLHLVESETHPAGSSYRTLKKWVLDKGD